MPGGRPSFRRQTSSAATAPTSASTVIPPPGQRRSSASRKPIRAPSIDANPRGLPVFSLDNDGTDGGRGRPTVVCSTNADEVDELVGCLQGPLTFDMEWPISRRKGHECKTAVIQLGSATLLLVVQISKMYYRIPRALLAVLLDPTRLKLGVNIRGDALKLKRDFGVLMRGFVDLSHLARAVDPLAAGPGRAIISLANLTAHYLGLHLSKPALRTGDWAAHLSPEAIAYAACDLHSTYCVLARLLTVMAAEEAGDQQWHGPRGLARLRALAGDLHVEREVELRNELRLKDEAAAEQKEEEAAAATS